MAENKREEWEIDRDREEIGALLARYPKITRRRIADVLNKRRAEEYKRGIADAGNLDPDEPIPDVRPPYELTRQMIDYDVRAIRAGWRKEYKQKFDEHVSAQLARAMQLHTDAYEEFERSKGEISEIEENKETVELKTTVGGIVDQVDGNLQALLSTRERGRKVVLPGGLRVRTKRKKSQQIGDPRLLMVVDRAQARIDKLLDLEASTKIDIDPRGALAALLGVPVDKLPSPDKSE